MNLKPKKRLFKYLLYTIAIILFCVLGFIAYLYSQGGQKNYTPPKVEKNTNEGQVVSDMISISHAIESYYAINLSYPSSLKNLVPEFISTLPTEPLMNGDYSYKVFADTAFEVSVQNPQNYNLKELRVRNGKLIKY
ncbi:MAG: hypothetical protein NTZ27_11965 [Ignavibacteriales bacterium]|nr:hypothetical protein [Ignavibacteriales bacterium]